MLTSRRETMNLIITLMFNDTGQANNFQIIKSNQYYIRRFSRPEIKPRISDNVKEYRIIMTHTPITLNMPILHVGTKISCYDCLDIKKIQSAICYMANRGTYSLAPWTKRIIYASDLRTTGKFTTQKIGCAYFTTFISLIERK